MSVKNVRTTFAPCSHPVRTMFAGIFTGFPGVLEVTEIIEEIYQSQPSPSLQTLTTPSHRIVTLFSSRMWSVFLFGRWLREINFHFNILNFYILYSYILIGWYEKLVALFGLSRYAMGKWSLFDIPTLVKRSFLFKVTHAKFSFLTCPFTGSYIFEIGVKGKKSLLRYFSDGHLCDALSSRISDFISEFINKFEVPSQREWKFKDSFNY